MAPEIFGFIQLVFIIIAITFIYLLKRILKQSESTNVNIVCSSIIGIITGILGSYFLALILTPIFGTLTPRAFAAKEGYKMLFWSLFAGFSSLGLIIGGLVGIILARKRDDFSNFHPQSKNTQNIKDITGGNGEKEE
jgi:formate-dependent nitrite reductase membrane component NrfD